MVLLLQRPHYSLRVMILFELNLYHSVFLQLLCLLYESLHHPIVLKRPLSSDLLELLDPLFLRIYSHPLHLLLEASRVTRVIRQMLFLEQKSSRSFI